jgi:hypothetical protein
LVAAELFNLETMFQKCAEPSAEKTNNMIHRKSCNIFVHKHVWKRLQNGFHENQEERCCGTRALEDLPPFAVILTRPTNKRTSETC